LLPEARHLLTIYLQYPNHAALLKPKKKLQRREKCPNGSNPAISSVPTVEINLDGIELHRIVGFQYHCQEQI